MKFIIIIFLSLINANTFIAQQGNVQPRNHKYQSIPDTNHIKHIIQLSDSLSEEKPEEELKYALEALSLSQKNQNSTYLQNPICR